MAPRRKRRRGNSARSPGADETDQPDVDSNDEQDGGDSTTPGTQTPAAPETTDQERLEHAQKLAQNQVSTAYSSYQPPQLSNQLDKYRRRMIAWKCLICGRTINRPAHDSSCSNLLTHAGRCFKKQENESKNRKLASVGVTGTGDLDPREVLQRCALWCAETASPFSALQSISHQSILHPTIVKNLPTRKIVSKAIHMLYLSVQAAFCEELKTHVGAMYLGVDAWQTPNGHDIIGAVIYRAKQEKGGSIRMDAMPLDFVQLKGSHTGEYLARMVQFIVEKFGLENRICGIVSDNTANNGTMISELKKLKWKRFHGEAQWIRCFAHILNLVVKAILRPFGTPKKKADSIQDLDDSDGEEEAQDLIDGFDGSDIESESEDEDELTDTVAKDTELGGDDELTLDDIQDLEGEDDTDVYTTVSCRQTLAKFRAIATKLKKSPNSKAHFITICQENECEKPHNIERDVPTRWNSTYKQIASIVRCKRALLVWQHDKQYGTPRRLHINQADLNLAQDLVDVLEPFYEFTLQLSIKASARVAEVVVFIDSITASLSTVVANEDDRYPPALRNACRAGVLITNKYYSLTDCSPIYRIAMVLHPSFKDEYFKLAKWPKAWIDKAIHLTREMYETWYKPKQPSALQRAPTTGPPKRQTGVLAGLGAAAIARSADSILDPIDIWLSGGLILDEGAPINGLKWWADQKRGGNTHHGLLQMALDVLCCPATTVDVERTFNFGRDYVSARRHNLDPKSISRGMALSFFSKNNKIKPLALHNYMNKIKDESKTRAKAKGKANQDIVTVD
ncbi:hypothetical protein PSTG_17635 [Puccinia striiformis f. sp. tritici PST-78]|uniref:HAT C-terminal dimerisation domain-containing protein n=1 Tax=Puccinia striiformis f. sp. tritici PST-78 TaxID=1165861 RepID=A0A0L0UPP6_9BASI|nr:hypothetical protein PSTG_17635 [Puccinia striiformis f. sp. tritici PST-78]